MTPTIEQLNEVVKRLALHVFDTERLLFALLEARDSESKFLADMLPNLTAEQRKTWQAAAARSETASEQLEAAMKQYRETFAQCPFWK